MERGFLVFYTLEARLIAPGLAMIKIRMAYTPFQIPQNNPVRCEFLILSRRADPIFAFPLWLVVHFPPSLEGGFAREDLAVGPLSSPWLPESLLVCLPYTSGGGAYCLAAKIDREVCGRGGHDRMTERPAHTVRFSEVTLHKMAHPN